MGKREEVSAERAGSRSSSTHLAAMSPEQASQRSPLWAAVGSAQRELTFARVGCCRRALRRVRSDEKVRHRLPTETALKVPAELPEALTQQVDGRDSHLTAGRRSSSGRRRARLRFARRVTPVASRGALDGLPCARRSTSRWPGWLSFLRWAACNGALQVSPGRFAGFALPALVVLMLSMLGGYRRRLRVLVLDWLRPLVSGVTLATVALAVLDLLNNGADHGSLDMAARVAV